MILNQDWIENFAKQHDDKADNKESLLEERIFKSIEVRGTPPLSLTTEILVDITEWKAARVKGYVMKNDEQYVKEVTQVSLSTNNEKLKIEVLTLLNLNGVQIRMASAILMFCFPDQYTLPDGKCWGDP